MTDQRAEPIESEWTCPCGKTFDSAEELRQHQWSNRND